MSVLVVGKFAGDTAVLRQSFLDRADEYVKIAEMSRAAGAVHHRFGIGDGFALIIDEWESADNFEKFFGDPQLQAFVASIGADSSVAPEITVVEAVSSPDEF
jgi:hypothetical protein